MAESMKITIVDNLRLSDVPPDFRQKLINKLKFPNTKWLENRRMGRWNRGVPKELRFYDKIGEDRLWIPRGFMRQLIILCRRHGIKYRIDDQRRILPPVNFIFNGQLKSFQRTAVDAMLERDFGTLSSATGSGKTVMALYIIARRKQPALIIVHTKELAFQWIERISVFLKIPPEDIGMIGDGKKHVGNKITVALVQSLHKCADEVTQHIGFLVVDECHRCPSRTFTEAVSCFDSRYMLGLTATPWRRDNLSKLIFWHMGDVHHEVNKKHLIESGEVLTAEVIVRKTEFRTSFDPVSEYSKMLSELTANDARNHLIAMDVALEAGRNKGTCLVLSDRKKHCATLQALLKYRHKMSSELLTGELSKIQRQQVVERLNNGQIKVLIATGQLIGEGFDCRNLSLLFLTTPIKFSGRVLQYLGRILRPAPGKKKASVYDYVDVNIDVLAKAATARQNAYML